MADTPKCPNQTDIGALKNKHARYWTLNQADEHIWGLVDQTGEPHTPPNHIAWNDQQDQYCQQVFGETAFATHESKGQDCGKSENGGLWWTAHTTNCCTQLTEDEANARLSLMGELTSESCVENPDGNSRVWTIKGQCNN